MQMALDDYLREYENLKNEKSICKSEALLADPCKDLFERSSRLDQEILAGGNKGMVQEKEQVKKEYEECLKNPPAGETYEEKKARCDAEFASRESSVQSFREQSKSWIAQARDEALNNAEQEYKGKHAALDVIEKKCN